MKCNKKCVWVPTVVWALVSQEVKSDRRSLLPPDCSLSLKQSRGQPTEPSRTSVPPRAARESFSWSQVGVELGGLMGLSWKCSWLVGPWFFWETGLPACASCLHIPSVQDREPLLCVYLHFKVGLRQLSSPAPHSAALSVGGCGLLPSHAHCIGTFAIYSKYPLPKSIKTKAV